jgi:hypothetical protein
MAVVALELGEPLARKQHSLRGFGAQFNTNLFTTAGESSSLSAEEKRALETTIKRLGLGHSRIFVRPKARVAGIERTALMKTIKLAQNAGANVNLTWWKGPFPHAPQKDHAKKRKKLMDDFAGIIAEARQDMDCVTHVTVMNEVNSYDIAKQKRVRATMELYDALYRDLDEALKKRGIRKSVALVGGDLVAKGLGKPVGYGRSCQDDWLDFMRAEMKDVLNGYSIHAYWEPHSRDFPKHPTERLKHLAKLGIEKPLYVTEYGVRQLAAKPRPGTFDGTPDGTKMEQSPDVGFQHAWFDALAPQCGCVGVVKWVLYKTSKRGEFGEWGMIGPRRGKPEPFHPWPACEVTRLFNHLIGPRWKADGLCLASGDKLLASAFKGPDGHQSVVVLNALPQPQEVLLGGLTNDGSYNAAEWNRDGTGELRHLEPLTTDGHGRRLISVPRRGLVALSTRPLPQ